MSGCGASVQAEGRASAKTARQAYAWYVWALVFEWQQGGEKPEVVSEKSWGRDLRGLILRRAALMGFEWKCNMLSCLFSEKHYGHGFVHRLKGAKVEGRVDGGSHLHPGERW